MVFLRPLRNRALRDRQNWQKNRFQITIDKIRVCQELHRVISKQFHDRCATLCSFKPQHTNTPSQAPLCSIKRTKYRMHVWKGRAVRERASERANEPSICRACACKLASYETQFEWGDQSVYTCVLRLLGIKKLLTYAVAIWEKQKSLRRTK